MWFFEKGKKERSPQINIFYFLKYIVKATEKKDWISGGVDCGENGRQQKNHEIQPSRYIEWTTTQVDQYSTT